MVMIILAAGKGERLLPLTEDRPKILVDLGDGTTLLSRQVATLSTFESVDTLVIGAGHYTETVESYVRELSPTIGSTVVHNPFFASSGPIVTLWITLSRIPDGDLMFMNGDTLYGTAIYQQVKKLLASDKKGIFLVVSDDPPDNSDEIGVVMTEDNQIFCAEKGIDSVKFTSAGLVIVRGPEARAQLEETLDALSRTPAFLDQKSTWHSLFRALNSRGCPAQPVFVDRSLWKEIDIHFELRELQKMLRNKLTSSGFTKD